MVNVAMLSYWHVHAPGYTEDIQEMPETDITVVWDQDVERGQEWADKLDADFVADLDEAVNRADVDAVVVNAATNIHDDVMVAAAEAGKHIFTEKVLALTVEEADRIVEAVEAADIEFCISLPRWTAPGVIFAKEAIEKGWLGDVTLMRSRVSHTGTIDDWLPERFLDPVEAGGGALMDLGAHPMYTTEYLLGVPEEITARFNKVVPDIDVEDNAVVVMEYENGGMAIVEASFSSRHSPFTLEIHGTEGTLFYGFPGEELTIQSSQLENEEVSGRIAPSQLPSSPASPIEQWIEAIQTGESVPFDVQAGRNLTAMMDGATRSAKADKPVSFPLE